MGPTIFAEMSALAARTQAINLGQGFPDSDGPTSVSERAVAALRRQDQPASRQAMATGAPWSHAARKFLLQRQGYRGLA